MLFLCVSTPSSHYMHTAHFLHLPFSEFAGLGKWCIQGYKTKSYAEVMTTWRVVCRFNWTEWYLTWTFQMVLLTNSLFAVTLFQWRDKFRWRAEIKNRIGRERQKLVATHCCSVAGVQTKPHSHTFFKVTFAKVVTAEQALSNCAPPDSK